MSRRAMLAVGVVALFASPRSAAAEEKTGCLKSYVDSQALRRDGKLRAARSAATTCAQDVCDERLRTDCVQWVRELAQSVPTVVLSVKGPDGRDRTDARVTLDGAAMNVHLDGAATEVDPGEHVFGCELPEERPVAFRAVVRQGEHDRPLRFIFPPHEAEGGSPRGGSARPIPAVVYALGAVGATGVAMWATFGLWAIYGSPGVKQLSQCSPSCSVDDKSAVARKLDVAGIAAAVGVVALGVGGVLYATRPTVAFVQGGAVVGGTYVF
jgi:hypothetical protein